MNEAKPVCPALASNRETYPTRISYLRWHIRQQINENLVKQKARHEIPLSAQRAHSINAIDCFSGEFVPIKWPWADVSAKTHQPHHESKRETSNKANFSSRCGRLNGAAVGPFRIVPSSRRIRGRRKVYDKSKKKRPFLSVGKRAQVPIE